MLDADGKAIMEEKEIKIPMYKPVTVFDVSQTEGKPLPQLAADLTGNVQNYEIFMEAVKPCRRTYAGDHRAGAGTSQRTGQRLRP